MSKKDKNAGPIPKAPEAEVAETEVLPPDVEIPSPLLAELERMTAEAAAQEDKFLRLAAEYDNFRRRSQKEKETIWAEAKADTALGFLPVYDNLERALKVDTTDAAYAKGVEMTMTGLKEALSKLGIEEIPSLGQVFDPNLHNAVMHIEDESVGAGVIAEVFQTGFQAGDKVIRFAMVKVAN